MAGILPALSSGAVVLYPLRRSVKYTTGITCFLNGTEQRWKKHAPLTPFVLQYDRVKAADRDLLTLFFNSQKGRFDSFWSMTVTVLANSIQLASSITYANMTFDTDVLQWTEQEPKQYSATLPCHQTQNVSAGTPTVPLTFPVMANGLTTQRPFVQSLRNLTSVQDQDTGIRHAWGWYDFGLIGFPTRALYAWELHYPVIYDPDLTSLETFYRGMNGAWNTFSFTDPDSLIVYPKCRFDSGFDVAYAGPGATSLTLKIIETN